MRLDPNYVHRVALAPYSRTAGSSASSATGNHKMTKNKRRTLRGRQKGRRVCRQSTARIWGKLYSYGGGYMLRTRIYTAHFSVLVLPLWVVIRRYSPAFTGKLLSADKRSISILLSLSGGLPSRRARKGEKSFNPGSSPDTSPKFFRRTHSRQSLSLAVSGLCLCLVPRDVHPAYWTQLYHPGKRRQRAGKKEIRALLSRFRSTTRFPVSPTPYLSTSHS